MKNLSRLIIFLAVLLTASIAWSAGTVTGNDAVITTGNNMKEVVFTCTGDSTDGSIPDTALTDAVVAALEGFYVYRAEIENDSGDASVTDNSDIYFYKSSASAGTTKAIDLLSGDGVDQLDDNTVNYIKLSSYEPITAGKTYTLSVANQSSASGVWYITITFVK